MKEEKEKPNKTKKAEQLKFGLLEVIILLIITALVTVVVTNTINRNRVTEKTTNYDSDIKEFTDEYNFILDKYYGEVDSKELIKNAIAGMVNSLEDPYSAFISDENASNFDAELDGEFYGLGAEIFLNDNAEIEINEVLDGYGAKKAGLQKGDIVTHMDGESIEGLGTAKFRSKVIESDKKNITLTIRRNGEKKDIQIEKTLVTIPSVGRKVFQSGEAKVGYIGISVFASNTYKQFKTNLEELENENIDSLIVDVRSNSGGHLSTVTNIISEFVDSSHVIYQVKDSKGVVKEYSSGNKNLEYPLIVLIDGASASASELLASALKEQAGAKLLGTKSFGKSTVQQVVEMENGSKYKITIKEWLTSLGNVINGVGITPDVQVKLSEDYINNPSDETDNQLNEAIKLLKK